MKVLATYSIKGGVGKTTTAVNLAYEAGRAGVRVLVWDLDPQGGATYLLRVRPKVRGGSRKLVSAKGALADHVRGTDLDAVHVLPADFSLRHLDVHLEGTREPTRRIASLLRPVRDHYDLAILDCPPSISRASESVFGAADVLLVPVVPATLASRTLGQLTSFLDDQMDAPAVAPFLSMVDRRRRLHRELVDSLGSQWPELLSTSIPAAAVIERMGTERSPLGLYAGSTPAARAYRRLWGEVATSVWGDAV
jgi:chromosome partitioning protein